MSWASHEGTHHTRAHRFELGGSSDSRRNAVRLAPIRAPTWILLDRHLKSSHAEIVLFSQSLGFLKTRVNSASGTAMVLRGQLTTIGGTWPLTVLALPVGSEPTSSEGSVPRRISRVPPDQGAHSHGYWGCCSSRGGWGGAHPLTQI